jgi:5-methylcytosine-specific restriction endonuclease McrA
VTKPFQPIVAPGSLSDDELLQRLATILKAARRVEAVLVAHLGEVEARRLFAREGSTSMFAYCTDVLHLSEPEAYLRIGVARAAREHPLMLTLLAEGRLHLSGVAKLVPHLTVANSRSLLESACGRSKRQIEEMLAALVPLPAAPAIVRRLPEPVQRSSAVAQETHAPAPSFLAEPARSARLEPPPKPLAPDRYRVQFTADASFCGKLDRLKDLLRTSVPDGDIAAIIDRAVTELVGRLEARRFGLTSKPRASGAARARDPSRHVPADVRRTVFARDGGQCCFVGPGGVRCPARRGLEYHHVEPHARGGAASLANIQLMCRTHNAHLAERDFGAAHMERFRKGAPSRPPPAAPSRA